MPGLGVIKVEESDVWCKRSGGARAAAALLTHQIPLFGEQRVAHVDFNVVDISVASLLATEAVLLKHALHLEKEADDHRQLEVKHWIRERLMKWSRRRAKWCRI